MPEQITKYPDVTLEVLKGAGAVCGAGAPQHILKQCPRDRFCSLPTGEMCIYGIKEIPKMTQIKPEELAEVVAPKARKCISENEEIPRITQTSLQEMGLAELAATTPNDPVDPPPLSVGEGMLLGVVFLVGLGLGKFSRRPRAPSAQPHQ